jgi:3-hydroxybutyrate dehydrogenase
MLAPGRRSQQNGAHILRATGRIMADRFSLSGKRALVTGAARGIGYAVSAAYAAADAEVVMLDKVPAIMAAAARLAAGTKREVRPIQAAVTDYQTLKSALVGLGRIDVLVNNAGIAYETPVDELSADAIDKYRHIIEVNVVGVYVMTRAALPLMGKGGRIINTSSAWGKGAGANFSAYVASKHAVIGLTRAWAIEFGPRGIAVNAVCPGTTATEMNTESLPKAAQDRLFSQMVIDPGFIPPDDLAQTFLFLASDAASPITGQSLSADRGQVMM